MLARKKALRKKKDCHSCNGLLCRAQRTKRLSFKGQKAADGYILSAPAQSGLPCFKGSSIHQPQMKWSGLLTTWLASNSLEDKICLVPKVRGFTLITKSWVIPDWKLVSPEMWKSAFAFRQWPPAQHFFLILCSLRSVFKGWKKRFFFLLELLFSKKRYKNVYAYNEKPSPARFLKRLGSKGQ